MTASPARPAPSHRRCGAEHKALRRHRYHATGILLLCWLVFLFGFIDRLAWGILAPDVALAEPSLAPWFARFVSAFYVGYVAMNLAGGLLVDRLGPARVLSVSTLLLGLATMGFGQVRTAAAGLALQASMGLAAGADYAACVRLLTAWFDLARRGRAFGLWYTSSSLAVMVGNLLLPPLAEGAGWRGAYLALGVATLLVGGACWRWLRDRPDAATPPRRAAPALGMLLHNRDLLLVGLAGFGALWGTWGFAFWCNALMVRGHGLGRGEAASIAALFGFGAVLAKPVIGWLADRWGQARRLPILLCLAAFAAMLLLFSQLQTAAAFRLAAPLLGVTAFGYSPLMATLIAELAGPARAGAASGASNAVWQLGNVAVPLVVGTVFQSTHSFAAALATLAAGPALGALVMLRVREGRA